MSDARTRFRVDTELLTGQCDPTDLTFETTDDLAPLQAVFGQERAVRAIEFALGMSGQGYNLFAAGPDGLGKTTIVESFLKSRADKMSAPSDWIYVHNFGNPDRPIGIELPAGQGHKFADAVRKTVEASQRELTQAFVSDSYVRQRGDLERQLERQRSLLLERLTTRAREMGFNLQMTPQGMSSSPVVDGQTISDEMFAALPQEQREKITSGSQKLQRTVEDAMLTIRSLERDAQEQLNILDEQVASFAIDHLFRPLAEKHAPNTKIMEFLEGVRDDLRRERDRFREHTDQPSGTTLGATQKQPFKRYEVNVAISNDADSGAPLITEHHPTYYNLLGQIEHSGQMGTANADHTMIKAGSLAMASGGFLVLRLRDLMQNTASYDGLKRALSAREVAVENLGESVGLVPTTALRAEPIPIDVKVVIVGDAALHSYLFRTDPDFRELFRVKADFETDLNRTPENIRGLASLIRRQCDQSGLNSFSKNAVARLVEHSSRMVEDQRRLSANMGGVTDLIRQANFWSFSDGASVVTSEHIDRALEESDYRSSLTRDRTQQLIKDGTIFIDTDGEMVGQINALSVYDMGDTTFGRPSRVTCVVSPGHGTIVNVERETNMAGRVHNKGFLILRGFLSERFGQNNAMSLHASLTFEQLYGDIDGDSASSTEIYAILSALSGIPIDQGVAITGSVNQHGQIQPIGGATAKIEGFHDICRSRGLNGRQGVMIPTANIPNVVLRPDVARSVSEGQFHIWAVDTIQQGIELLTGMEAGERLDNYQYPEGTLFRQVEDRLDEFYHAITEHKDGGRGETPSIVTPSAPTPVPPGIPPQPPPNPPIIV